jgi:ATP-dependent phosphofructokinase / diphosphate-dependent phosphofructokinase
MIKTIGLVTGGGDAPGLNAVIRAVVRTAVGEFGLRVIGIEDSFEGLLGDEPRTRELTIASVRGLLPQGGTILGTRNKGSFVHYDKAGKITKPEKIYQEAIANIKKLNIDGLVVLGGEGTLTIASEFERLGIPVVGVPKTIDNDLAATDLTFGFLTALDIATQALDRLHSTAESHDRVMILEVMGRHTGWIALQSGIAGGADIILIPEIPFTMESIVDQINDRDRDGSLFSIIVVAEGAKEFGSVGPLYQDMGARDRVARLGGIGNYLQHEIERLTGKETRCVVLGHLQRGGSPNAFDRIIATNFGTMAVRSIVNEERNVMIALKGADVVTVSLSEAIANLKTVPPDGDLIRSARDIGVSFGAPIDID